MKELLTRTLAALALVALVAAPAAAGGPDGAVEPPARTDALIEPAATAEAPAETPIEVQVPADLPDRGHACVLPPPQQTDPCICPLIFDPVCGCNDVTYSNSCFASCEVRTWDEGACE